MNVFPSSIRPVASATLLAVLLLAGCGERAAPTAQAEPPAPSVQGNQIRFSPDHPQLKLLAVVPATSGRSVRVDLPARLVWNEERTQRMFAPFAGRVTDIKADVGQRVKSGDLLAQLASPDFGIAQADTAKAQADMSFSRKNLQRQRELFEAGIIARKDLEQAEADNARSQAEASRANARTTMYAGGSGVNQRFGLRSGINGVVVERNINPGQELRPDQSGAGMQALFVVTDPTSLWVQIDAKENDVGSLRAGAAFTLQVPAYPDETFTGRVTAASDFIDPTTRTIKIRGVIDNPDRRLKGEMLVTAVVTEALEGTVVPARAVTLDGSNQTVYVQVQPGVFEPRKVVLGHIGTQEVVVVKGLAAGEQVVADNALLLARQFAVAREDAMPSGSADTANGAAKK